MSADRDAARARAYLLGHASDRDQDLVEQEYFRSADALDTIEAAEESLIEDYLAGQLGADDRVRFEQHYLASPHHRTRVDAIQRLMKASRRDPLAIATSSAGPRESRRQWLALAAGLIVAVGMGAWFVGRMAHSDRDRPSAPSTPTPVSSTPTPQTAPLVAFAWTVSPLTVRGATDTPALVIPAGTAIVRLQLEGEPNAPPIARGRVLIRTVAGEEVWQGSVAASSALPATVAAIVEVPVDRLRADDYTIILLDAGASGATVERSRYFLRVRAR